MSILHRPTPPRHPEGPITFPACVHYLYPPQAKTPPEPRPKPRPTPSAESFADQLANAVGTIASDPDKGGDQ